MVDGKSAQHSVLRITKYVNQFDARSRHCYFLARVKQTTVVCYGYEMDNSSLLWPSVFPWSHVNSTPSSLDHFHKSRELLSEWQVVNVMAANLVISLWKTCRWSCFQGDRRGGSCWRSSVRHRREMRSFDAKCRFVPGISWGIKLYCLLSHWRINLNDNWNIAG